MSVKRSGGLGRNLSALLGQSAPILTQESQQSTTVLQLALSALQAGKYQPRTDFPEESLAELAESIKHQGLLQPLVVREIDANRYEIIAGERRFRAAELAGLTHVPVIVHQVNDEMAMALALVENLQREDLNAMDQARAMYRLTQEFALTHQQIATLLSKSRAAVSNYLRLMSLSADVRRLLEYGDLDMGHARALLTLNEMQQSQVAKIIVAKNLSVRETEQLVKRVQSEKAEKAAKIELDFTVTNQLQNLAQHLKTKVNIKQGKAGQGSLVIHYNSLKDLETVFRQIMG